MKIIKTNFPEVFIIEPQVFQDHRGYFFESFQESRYCKLLPNFVQDNVSKSKHGVIRGLHYQQPHAQGKLVGVLRGQVYDVVVDIRKSSPQFGQFISVLLDDQSHQQLYVPPGFAHGFQVLSEEAYFYYKCTVYYAPEHEKGICFDDIDIAIPWPINTPTVSNKDRALPKLRDLNDAALFP